MSKIQDVKSSVANEVVTTTTMEADKKFMLADYQSNQLQTSSTIAESMATDDEAVDKVDPVVQNSIMSSETIGRETSDNEKSMNIKTDETNNETVTAKRNQVIEKSVSGECRNILPVLVEHLRSALQFSTTMQNQNIVDDSHVPNDYTTKPTAYQTYSHHINEDSTKSQQPTLLRTMDLNFFEDLLLADIKTALARLQDMLSRVDVDAISRYSSSLEPNDKLHLLQLISNLVSNLKMVKSDDTSSHTVATTNKIKQHHSRGRNRHTIGVSSEELARARKWLEERGPIANTPIGSLSSRTSIIEPYSVILPQQENVSLPDGENLKEQSFDNPRACEKHMKDAINQQQSLQNRSRDKEIISNSPIANVHESPKIITDMSNNSKYKEPDGAIDHSTVPAATFLIKSSCNKFTAKKSKIKRANTIDIPNYIKLQAENNKQSSSPGLRRPIDISDRLSWNPPEIINMSIPSFEPKTENDRKFLALINRNNDTNNQTISGSNSPFKSFNYRQTSSIADENWKSRFSNIKTTFDKTLTSASSFRKNSGEINKSLIKNYSKDCDKESLAEVVIPSIKLSQSIQTSFLRQDNNSPPRKFPIFTHAASSPFQKIQTTTNNSINEDKPISSSSGYLPACATSGMLRAKLKIFDHPEHTNNLISRDNRPTYPRPTTHHNTRDKIIQEDTKINSHINYQTNMRNYNNSNPLHMENNYKSRRNSTYHEEITGINKGKIDAQRRQSVAVQTMNYPIKDETHMMKDINVDQTFVNTQPNNSYLNQQTHQLPQTSSIIPETNCYLSSEKENPIYVSPETIPSTHLHVLIVNNLSHPAMTNGIAQLSCNHDTQAVHNNNCSNINNIINNNNADDDDKNNNYEENVDIDNGNTTDNNDTSIIDDSSFMDDINIENQDISDNGIVTRYTSAIVTLEKSPSPPPPPQYSAILSTNSSHEQSDVNMRPSLFCPTDNVQRHNMLQQRLIRRLQLQDEELQQTNRIIKPNKRYSTVELDEKYNLPQFNLPILSQPSSSIESDCESSKPLIENNNTQEKINLFEGKLVGRNDQIERRSETLFPPKIWTHMPDESVNIPKNNITYSSSIPWQHIHDFPLNTHSTPSTPFKYQTGPGDSSDEYLVSCASQPHRSIVLSKSESWHQLAMSKNHLSVPQQRPQRPQHRPPPKINSHPLKYTEGVSTDNLKKMEEKVQRYFHSSNNAASTITPHASIKQSSRRSFSPRKSQGTLARSHTMPHVYDELTDIDKQFDSLFEESKYDKRHLI